MSLVAKSDPARSDRAESKLIVLGHPSIRESETAISFSGVPLEKRADTQHVPDRGRFGSHVITDFDAEVAKNIAVGFALNQPVLVEGGSGLGKTATAERMCAQLGWSCFYINCSKFDPEIMIGGTRAVAASDSPSGFAWKDGVVLQAVRHGGVLVLDEYNYLKQATHGRLHDLLDAILDQKGKISVTENNGEEVKIHPNLRIVAFQNAPDTRTNATRLDNANITRFTYLTLGEALLEKVWQARTVGLIGIEAKNEYDAASDLHFTGGRSLVDLRKIEGIEKLLNCYREFHKTVEDLTKSGELGADQSQPIYFAYQRDLNRLITFLNAFSDANPLQTLHYALEYYYVSRFISDEDKKKVRELIGAISLSEEDDPNRVSLAPVSVAIAHSGAANKTLLLKDLPRDPSGVEYFKILTAHSVPFETAIKSLCGDGSVEANQLRIKALDEGINPDIVLYSLAGVDGAESHEIRRRCWKKGQNSHFVLHSLAGGVSEPSWATVDQLFAQIFKENKSNGPLFENLFTGAIGLIGRYDENAAKARKMLQSFKLKTFKTIRTVINPLEFEMWGGQETKAEHPFSFFGFIPPFPLFTFAGIRKRLTAILALTHAASDLEEAKAARMFLATKPITGGRLQMPYRALALSLAYLPGAQAQATRRLAFPSHHIGNSDELLDANYMSTSLVGVESVLASELRIRCWGIGERLNPGVGYFELANQESDEANSRRQSLWKHPNNRVEKANLFGIFSNPYTLALEYGAKQNKLRNGVP